MIECGFEGSYEQVRRFVRKVPARWPEGTSRIECEPGDEAQIDFDLDAGASLSPVKSSSSPPVSRATL